MSKKFGILILSLWLPITSTMAEPVKPKSRIPKLAERPYLYAALGSMCIGFIFGIGSLRETLTRPPLTDQNAPEVQDSKRKANMYLLVAAVAAAPVAPFAIADARRRRGGTVPPPTEPNPNPVPPPTEPEFPEPAPLPAPAPSEPETPQLPDFPSDPTDK